MFITFAPLKAYRTRPVVKLSTRTGCRGSCRVPNVAAASLNTDRPGKINILKFASGNGHTLPRHVYLGLIFNSRRYYMYAMNISCSLPT